MSIIGTFTKQDNGYQGNIATLTFKAKVNLSPVEKKTDKSPDFRVRAGKVEIGAAWAETSKENNQYLSVKLDDPSFPAPIFARLVQTDDGHTLIWTRPEAKKN